jgi:hypothetical protein
MSARPFRRGWGERSTAGPRVDGSNAFPVHVQAERQCPNCQRPDLARPRVDPKSTIEVRCVPEYRFEVPPAARLPRTSRCPPSRGDGRGVGGGTSADRAEPIGASLDVPSPQTPSRRPDSTSTNEGERPRVTVLYFSGTTSSDKRRIGGRVRRGRVPGRMPHHSSAGAAGSDSPQIANRFGLTFCAGRRIGRAVGSRARQASSPPETTP